MSKNKDLVVRGKEFLDVREKLLKELFDPHAHPEYFHMIDEKIKLWDTIHELDWWHQ